MQVMAYSVAHISYSTQKITIIPSFYSYNLASSMDKGDFLNVVNWLI